MCIFILNFLLFIFNKKRKKKAIICLGNIVNKKFLDVATDKFVSKFFKIIIFLIQETKSRRIYASILYLLSATKISYERLINIYLKSSLFTKSKFLSTDNKYKRAYEADKANKHMYYLLYLTTRLCDKDELRNSSDQRLSEFRNSSSCVSHSFHV